MALNNFDGCKSYATMKNALKRLDEVLQGIDPAELPQTLIAVNTQGRFVPVAVGQKAAQLGLHFHIPVVG